MKLTDKVGNTGLTAGKLVLSPTRTYAPVVKEVLDTCRDDIHGMIHCSGGAQTKVLHFVDNLHVIKDDLFDPPPLFQMIRENSDTSWKEMYQVFNMGHRFEFYVPEKIADNIIHIAEKYNVEGRIIGSCEAYKGKRLTIRTLNGIFEY